MPPADQSAWKRAGRMLAARRVQISPRYANRRTFAAETGMNWRTLHDVELAKRDNFRPETLRAFETAYRLAPGSLARTLEGGELEPLPVPRIAPVPAPPAGSEAEAEGRFMDLLLRADPRDLEVLRIIGRALDSEGDPMPWSRRLAIAADYLARFDRAQERSEGTALPVRLSLFTYRNVSGQLPENPSSPPVICLQSTQERCSTAPAAGKACRRQGGEQMRPAPSSLETALQGLADAVRDAAELADRAAGSALEAGALNVYRQLLATAAGIAEHFREGTPDGDLALGAAVLYSGVMQSRKTLASREISAEALDAARRRGSGEDFRAGYGTGARAERARARRAPPARTGQPDLKPVTARPA